MAVAQLVFSLVLYLLGGLVVGVSLYPGLYLTHAVWEAGAGWPLECRVMAAALGLGCTYFIPWCNDYPDLTTMTLLAERVMPEFR